MNWPDLSWWIALGFVGQMLFTARFLVQWIASERKGKSVVPIHFWLLSLGGSMVLLIYSIHRRDPVFILGQSTGAFIYIRNLMLIRKNAKRAQE